MNCQCPGPCVEHPVKMTMLGPAVNVNPLDPLVASCEIESLRKKLDEALAWKHLMTIQLTSSEREKAKLLLQNRELEEENAQMRGTLQYSKSEREKHLELQADLLHEYIGLLREELDSAVGMACVHGWRSTPEKIAEGNRLRKELGLPDRVETSTPEKRKCQVCDARSPEICSACMGTGLEL